ncbi:molybdopterin molybdenumtransferase MoeA [Thermacetogenium phaeum DSM 12270]|uniref:Molybdopterin molybdenumtransferase n=1 Tax=Thermacetogenium phaeum (strain ATCC BAA-254 / DSM 26808 / PB) TaxID=1089553 RepID=K4LEM5_THEPS|nr:gephyrin-like molybdotransferase Glp [Thermacetogenium phaeum]AFV10425.1 molybdopterin molybdenumtransferase MoeA [Thermacetogenium phaeum DSM 12270]
MKINVSLEEAQELVLSMVNPVGETVVSLPAALGRVISRDLIAPFSEPSFDKSAFDGYAVRAGDTRSASSASPVVLQVIEEVSAGSVPVKKVVPGCAIRIMTGAPLPEGADAVVPFEDVEEALGSIVIRRPLAAGSGVIPTGNDVLEGEVIARRGRRVNALLIGVLASLGITRVPVYDQVRVAIINTGSELLDPSEKRQLGKIYVSNRYLLEARCREVGAEPVYLEGVPDEKGAIAGSLKKALEKADLVITTGGTSAGRYDVIKEALSIIGAQILFSRVAIKPGKSVIASHKDEKIILSLAGNPTAAMVTFDLVAVPAIKRMSGLEDPLLPVVTGILAGGFPSTSPRRRLLMARWKRQNGLGLIELAGKQGNVLKSSIDCNLLVDVPAGSPPLAAGQSVAAFVVGNLNDSLSEDE